jgi:hypothetical protein
MNYSKPVRNPKPVDDPIPLRILITGDRTTVQSTIDQLCALGFCDRARWSPVLPQVNGQGYFSIMTR